MASIHGINISPGMNARGPAAPVGPEGNCSRAPTARPSGPRDPLLAADAPTAAPEATPARAKIAATSTPRSAMPSEAASARNGRHVGWRHGRPAQRRKRLGLMRCQRHHQPKRRRPTIELKRVPERHVGRKLNELKRPHGGGGRREPVRAPEGSR